MKKNGHLLVDTHSQYDNKGLGRWINKQRVDYKNIGSPKANANFNLDRIKKLEAIGMVWDVSSYLWDKNYALLKDYYDHYGNINITDPSEYKGVRLGKWLQNQRGCYRGYNEKRRLTDDQISRLEKLGMKW